MKTERINGMLVVWIVVAAIVIFVGALFALGVFEKNKFDKSGGEVRDEQVERLKTIGTSDEVDDIESYLDETDIESLDQELDAIDRELKGL